MKNRKTIDVKLVLERANYYLTNPDSTTDGRVAVMGLIEGVLHTTGNYAGFGYLETYEPGKTDETRRQYYVHRNL